jgi:4'-phosphopantetheinyl transferase
MTVSVSGKTLFTHVPRLVAARRPGRSAAFHLLSRVGPLSPAERDRILAFRRWEDAVSSLLARSLMVELAVAGLGCAPADVRLEREASGRPFVAAPSVRELDVNASHGGVWVAAAASAGRIGVDVEPERPISAGLVERCLSTQERAHLEGLPREQVLACFFQLWTIKEAYLKAIGAGLSVDPRSIVVVLTDDGQAVLQTVPGARRGERWRAFSWNPEHGVWLSVCTDRELPARVELREAGAE